MSAVSTEECKECGKAFNISKLNICAKCKKIVCGKCLGKLSRTTDEVNFENHYLCFDEKKKGDEPGIFVRMYIDPNSRVNEDILFK